MRAILKEIQNINDCLNKILRNGLTQMLIMYNLVISKTKIQLVGIYKPKSKCSFMKFLIYSILWATSISASY